MAKQSEPTFNDFIRAPGMRTFLTVWAGQLVSSIGSSLTGFAMGVYIYQQTGDLWLLAANAIAFNIPFIFIAPFSGALVDRIDRKWAMILSDSGAGLSTLGIVILHLLVDSFGVGKVLAQAIAIVLVTPWNFVGNKLWSFGRGSRP